VAAALLAGFIAVALVLIPIWQTQATLSRHRARDSGRTSSVIQDQGKVLLNSGTANTARFAVLPFAAAGINQINWAIATNSQFSTSSGWLERTFASQTFIIMLLQRKKYNQSGNFERSAIASWQLPVLEHWSNGGSWLYSGSLSDAQTPMFNFRFKVRLGYCWGISSPTSRKLALTRRLPAFKFFGGLESR